MIVTLYGLPVAAPLLMVPEIVPVLLLMERPEGSPVALKVKVSLLLPSLAVIGTLGVSPGRLKVVPGTATVTVGADTVQVIDCVAVAVPSVALKSTVYGLLGIVAAADGAGNEPGARIDAQSRRQTAGRVGHAAAVAVAADHLQRYNPPVRGRLIAGAIEG